MEGTPVFMRGTVNNTEDDFGDLTGPYKIALKDLKDFFKETFGSYVKDVEKAGETFFLGGALKEPDPDGMFTRIRVIYHSELDPKYAKIEVDVDNRSEFGDVWKDVLQKEGFYKTDSAKPYGIIPFAFKTSLIDVKKLLSRIITVVQKRKANKARDLSLDTEEKFYANRGMIPSNKCFVIEAGNSEIQISKTEGDTQALAVTVVGDLEESKPFYAHDAKELSDGIASILTRLWHDDISDITAEEVDQNPAGESNLEKAAAEVKSSTEFTTPNGLGRACDFNNIKSIEKFLNQLTDHWTEELYAFEDMQNEIAERSGSDEVRELTHEDWMKNPTPREMFVWDDDFEDRVMERVTYICADKDMRRYHVNYKVQVPGGSFKHCAEIERVPEAVLKCIPLIMPEWDPIELTGTPETTPNANRQKRLAKIQANRAASGQFKEDNHLPRSRSLKEGLVTKYNPKTGLYELRDSK